MIEKIINELLFEIIQAIKSRVNVNELRVNKLFDDLNDVWARDIARRATFTYRQVETQNIQPLKNLIAQRQATMRFTISQYRLRFFQSTSNIVSFGRRTNDVIRRTSLNSLRRSFLFGDSEAIDREFLRRAFSRSAINVDQVFARRPGLYPRINRAGLTDRQLATALEIRGQLSGARSDILDRIVVFNESGKSKFFLRQSNGWHAWDINTYVDLVVNTTAREAFNEAMAAKGARTTGFVGFNKTGKAYSAKSDPVCKEIDGKIYSTTPGGVTVKGVFYEYWKTALGGQFSTPHPHCEHRLSVAKVAA